MKKLIITLLCLMLVLPLYAYADGTESQPSIPAESQTTESQPAESKPTESQPTESQPTESKPTENQPAESQPDESKPAESQPAESKPTEPQPSDHTHVWDVSYTIPATCKQEGAAGYGCSACKAIRVEVLPKLTEHVYGSVCDADCNVCGITREAEHKFSSQWSKNASGHWHACSSCGEQGDFGKHYPGPAATEEKAQLCLTCGYTLTAKRNHTHKYDTKFTSDEEGHWHACTGCEEKKDLEAHSYDDACDPDCNICGFQTATSHTYTGDWFCDEAGHWDVCTLCQEKSPVEPHIPGPDATETEAQVCLACSFELAPMTAATVPTEHVHEAEGAWRTDDESHWKACTCGEELEKQPHNWDAGEEQEEKSILYTCKDCDATRTEEKSETGINPLIWIGAVIVALLAAAAGILFLIIPRLSKGGKYHK